MRDNNVGKYTDDIATQRYTNLKHLAKETPIKIGSHYTSQPGYTPVKRIQCSQSQLCDYMQSHDYLPQLAIKGRSISINSRKYPIDAVDLNRDQYSYRIVTRRRVHRTQSLPPISMDKGTLLQKIDSIPVSAWEVGDL